MKPSKHRYPMIALAALTVLASAVASAAAANIFIDDITPPSTDRIVLLVPDLPEQTVTIKVSGGEQVSGMNFRAQIGDGGPDGPAFTAVDLKTGTIFNGIVDEQQDDGSTPQVVFYSIAIAEDPIGSVLASGTLATLTIDTSGFVSGTWDLLLSGVLAGYPGGPVDTELLDEGGHLLSVTIDNGWISLARYGDCNRDGYVNAGDLTILTAHWLCTGVGWDEGDFNGDGRVDDADATLLAVNLQSAGSTAAQAVPEPSVAALLSLGLSALLMFAAASFGRFLLVD